MVARSTASKRWRLDRKHGRRRPPTGVTTPEQQRPVRQGKVATRHGLSRQRYVNDVRPSHSTPIDSTATPVDGSTTTRPSTNYSVALDSSRLNSSTHGRQFVSSSGSTTCPSHSIGLSTPTTSTLTTVATVVGHRNSSATRAQFHSHCVSVIHINRLTDYYNGP